MTQENTTIDESFFKETLEMVCENSYCFFPREKIEKNFKLIKELTQLLSYEIPGAKYNKNLPDYLKRKNLFYQDKKTGNFYFPTGLIFLVVKHLRENKIPFFRTDQRKAPQSKEIFRFVSRDLPELRNYQKSILEKSIVDHRGVIESATGTGKTRIILELVKSLSLKTLVVVPSLSILNQTNEIFTKAFGKRMVGHIYNKTEREKSIIIANYQSLDKLDASFWDTINVLVIDEFHHSAAETFQRLNRNFFNKIYYRYGFTGTNFRNDGTDIALQGVLSHLIFKYDAKTAIDEGFLCKPKFISIPFAEVSIGRVNSWQDDYREGIVENSSYNQIVAQLGIYLNSQSIPTIIFVDQIAHGETILKLIPEAKFVNGTEKSLLNKSIIDDFNSGKFNILIGTSVIGEGVDTVRAACGIMAGGGKAKSEIIQKIGRILRLSPDKKEAFIIDFEHKNRYFVGRHYRIRKEIYEEYQSDMIYLQDSEVKDIIKK